MKKLKTLAWMYPFFKPYMVWFYVVIALAIVSTALGLSYPYLSKVLIDDVFIEPKYELSHVLIIGFSVVLLGMLLQALNGYLYLKITLQVIKSLRVYLFNRVQSIRYDALSRIKVGDMTTRINGDLNEIQRVITDGVLSLITNVITFIFIMGMLLYLDWKLFLLCTIAIPILGLSIYYFRPKVISYTRRIREGHSEIMGTMIDTLKFIKLVKVSNGEGERSTKLEKKIERLNKNSLMFAIIQNLAEGIPRAAIAAVTGLVLLIGGKSVLAGALTVGSLLAFTTYLGRFFSPIQSFAGLYMSFQKAFVSADRIQDYLNLPMEENDHSKPIIHLNQSESLLSVKGLTKQLPQGLQVMNHVDFNIADQSTTALLGPSGTGKSTIIHSLIKLTQIESGDIYLKNTNINDFPLHQLRREIQVVSQDNEILNETIRENLLLGLSKESRLKVSDEMLEKVCEVTGILLFIKSLPQEFDTAIYENGSNLSGGQKQRIAIARALLKDPTLLILDEATSGLDQVSERKLFIQLQQWVQEEQGRALLIISHRLSSVKWVDQLLLLDKGRIIEKGTHEELSGRSDLYRSWATEPVKEGTRLYDSNGFLSVK